MNTLKKNRGMLFPVGVFVLVLLIALVSGCNKESKGFALPAGDLEAGKATFEALNCNACHSIADIQWKGQDEELRLPLGGETTRIKTYGELVTSVINPSHYFVNFKIKCRKELDYVPDGTRAVAFFPVTDI
jgi:hypothetical protein